MPNPGRKTKDKQSLPVFLKKLVELIQESTTLGAIVWNKNGTNFSILKPRTFAKEVLPKYYKSSFNSFVRQLNFYGFKKMQHLEKENSNGTSKIELYPLKNTNSPIGEDSSVNAKGSRTQKASWTFYHPYFIQNRSDLLHKITRKTYSESGAATKLELEMLRSEVDAYSNVIEATDACRMQALEQRFTILQKELQELHRLQLSHMKMFKDLSYFSSQPVFSTDGYISANVEALNRQSAETNSKLNDGTPAIRKLPEDLCWDFALPMEDTEVLNQQPYYDTIYNPSTRNIYFTVDDDSSDSTINDHQDTRDQVIQQERFCISKINETCIETSEDLKILKRPRDTETTLNSNIRPTKRSRNQDNNISAAATTNIGLVVPKNTDKQKKDSTVPKNIWINSQTSAPRSQQNTASYALLDKVFHCFRSEEDVEAFFTQMNTTIKSMFPHLNLKSEIKNNREKSLLSKYCNAYSKWTLTRHRHVLALFIQLKPPVQMTLLEIVNASTADA